MEKYFERFGSNFIVSAFVPSLTFITVSVVLFLPLVPDSTSTWFQIPVIVQNFPALGVVILLFGILLSFTLTSLNTFFLKLMEGYVFFNRFPFLLEREKRRARKIRKKVERVKAETERLEKRIESTKSDNVRSRYIFLLQQNTSRHVDLTASYQQQFSLNASDILPTPFGNILKAAEYYPADRYGIDSVTLWSRLIHFIDRDFMELIDESRNELSFLVNCSLLCLIFGFISIPVTVYVAYIRPDQIYVYIASGTLALAASYIFHRASLFSVGQYGDMIRATYDLFRKRLLKALGYSVPENVMDERDRWITVVEFLKAGVEVHPFPLEYEPLSEPEIDPKRVIPVALTSVRKHSRKGR